VKYGDETIVFLEIDQPLCAQTYGVAPCAAVLGTTGTSKCYNSRVTCQDVPDYTPGTLTLRFSRPQEGLGQYGYVIPSMEDAPTTTPTSINLANMDPSSKGFGRREVVNITLNDHRHSDLLVDKYRLERASGVATSTPNGLDFDFTKATLVAQVGAALAAITFTRAGATATRVNAAGFIEVVAADTPRFDYYSVDVGRCRGLLIEEARTNYFKQTTGWGVGVGVTKTANARVGPYGTVTMDKLDFAAVLNANVSQDTAAAIANGQVWTFSVWIYAAAPTTIDFQFLSSPSFAQWSYEPTMSIPAGLSRITATAPAVSGITTDTGLRIYLVTRDSVARTIYVESAQMELGAFATSDIPTTTAAVTRNADSALVSSLGSWFNASEGTLVAEAQSNPSGIIANQYVAEFQNTTFTSARILLFRNVNSLQMFDQDAAGVIQVNSSLGVAANGGTFRASYAYKLNDFAGSLDGAAVVSDTLGTIPTVDKLRLGGNTGNTENLNGWLRRFRYFPRRLSNAELAVESAMLGSVMFSGAFDPYAQGTFWGKWLARNPFHQGAYRCRVRDGVVGQALTGMRVRNYLLDRVEGPSNGQVKVVLKDLFSRVEDVKAVAPVASKGELQADITSAATAATLNPVGIGASYPASGYAAIGDEVVSFTRVGDALTLVRGQLNTVAAAHSTQDLVQLVYNETAQRPHDIAYRLLTTYAGILASEIDKADWDLKAADITELYTGRIVEPTPVATLIAELSEQAGFTVWPDTATGMVKFAALRSAAGTVTVTDNEWIVDGSLKTRRQDNKRASQVWMYYGQIKPTLKLDERRNYNSRLVAVDLVAEGAQEYNAPAIREVFSRWVPQFGRTSAQKSAERILNMFRTPPLEASFALHASRAGQLGLATYFNLLTAEVQDVLGAQAPVLMAPVEIESGESELRVRAQQVAFAPPSTGPTETVIYIENDAHDLNLRTIYNSNYQAPVGTEIVRFVVQAGVKVGATSTAGPALRTGTWPTGVALTLENRGRIQGKGGAPGVGVAFSDGAPGSTGGDALLAEYVTTVNNLSQIWAGAGGGGAGGSQNGTDRVGGDGGGGCGFDPVTNSSTEAGGSGLPGNCALGICGGRGGDGGGPGLDGAAGGASDPSPSRPGGVGGSRGKYISGNSFVTWTTLGDVRGAVS
jgi:hypothetical protein